MFIAVICHVFSWPNITIAVEWPLKPIQLMFSHPQLPSTAKYDVAYNVLLNHHSISFFCVMLI